MCLNRESVGGCLGQNIVATEERQNVSSSKTSICLVVACICLVQVCKCVHCIEGTLQRPTECFHRLILLLWASLLYSVVFCILLYSTNKAIPSGRLIFPADLASLCCILRHLWKTLRRPTRCFQLKLHLFGHAHLWDKLSQVGFEGDQLLEKTPIFEKLTRVAITQ